MVTYDVRRRHSCPRKHPLRGAAFRITRDGEDVLMISDLFVHDRPTPKFHLHPKGTVFVFESERGAPPGEFPTVVAAVERLQSMPGARGSIVVVFNSYGRPELQLNL
jgi:hypothetical protein